MPVDTISHEVRLGEGQNECIAGPGGLGLYVSLPESGGRAQLTYNHQREAPTIDKAVTNAAERAGVDQVWVLRKPEDQRRPGDAPRRPGRRQPGSRVDRQAPGPVRRQEISYIDDADEYLGKIMAIVDAKVVEHEPLAIDQAPAEDDDSVH